MRSYFFRISFIIIVVSLLSCTHNNGDIGPLFGQWKLTTLLIDENPDKNYKGNIYFSFQNDVTNMKIINDNQNVYDTYGHWKQEGNKLLLIYDDPIFPPLLETYFNPGINICEIITLDNKELILKRVTEDKTYTYKFK